MQKYIITIIALAALALATQQRPVAAHAQSLPQTTVTVQPTELALGTPAVPASKPEGSDAGEVSLANAWVSALDAHNFQDALSLLDNDPYITFLPPPERDGIATYSGRAEIAAALQSYVQENVHVRMLGEPTIDHGTLTWIESQSSDSLRALGVLAAQVQADALVQDGKLKSIVYELSAASTTQITEALGTAGVEPGSPWLLRLVGLAASGAQTSGVGMPRTGHGSPLGVPFPFWALIAISAVACGALTLKLVGKQSEDAGNGALE